MSVSVGILDYILTGILPLPRWDARLVAWDHALGFDWRDWYAWVVRHPALHAIFHTVYGLLGPEMLALFITLELAGHAATAKAFLRQFILTAMITVFIGTLMPAAGAFVYYHLPVAAHTGYVPVMTDLRNGTLRNINLFNGQGLVVFPSFHTTLAVLCAAATWPWHRLRLPALLFNLLIIFSAMSEGGHYLVDILAGLLLGVMAIAFIPPAKSALHKTSVS